MGLIGAGISRSMSPTMYETEAAAQGILCQYDLMDLEQRGLGIDRLEDLLSEAERNGLAGVNVTLPCKQVVIPLLHELSPEASAIGAVNTVRFQAGRRIGYNTDAAGFSHSFKRGLPNASLSSVVQVGAGGAGAAAGFALLQLGARQLILFDACQTRVGALVADLVRHFPDRKVVPGQVLEDAVLTADGVLNATPLGMPAHPGSALPTQLLRPHQWVSDVVYFPPETELLRAARHLGCRTLGGAGMFVNQAAQAFEIFTGCAANVERMALHFERICRLAAPSQPATS